MITTSPEYEGSPQYSSKNSNALFQSQINEQSELGNMLETSENMQKVVKKGLKRNQRYNQLKLEDGLLEEAVRISESGAHVSSQKSFKHPSGEIINKHEQGGSNPPKENRPRLDSNNNDVVKPETHSPKKTKPLLKPRREDVIEEPDIAPLTQQEQELVISRR